jgi:hypothetical protein
VGKQFSVRSVRALPGTPRALEACRSLIVDRYGILAFSVVQVILGTTGEVDAAGLRRGLASIGFDMKIYEVNQIIAFLTPTDKVSLEKFLYALKGNIVGFETNFIDKLYQYVKTETASETISWSQILRYLNQEQYPEVLEAMYEYASVAYFADVNNVQFNELVALFQDMYAATPETYDESMRNIWNIEQ